jgi:hypothetical protein
LQRRFRLARIAETNLANSQTNSGCMRHLLTNSAKSFTSGITALPSSFKVRTNLHQPQQIAASPFGRASLSTRVSAKTRARDAAKSCLELGSQKAPSTHQRCCDTACTRSVTTYCGACNVTTACLPLCATYGEGRSEHRASQAQDGHSKRQLYRKGLLGDGWCCSHRQRGIKAGSNKIFPALSKGDETPQAVTEDSSSIGAPRSLKKDVGKNVQKCVKRASRYSGLGRGTGDG